MRWANRPSTVGCSASASRSIAGCVSSRTASAASPSPSRRASSAVRTSQTGSISPTIVTVSVRPGVAARVRPRASSRASSSAAEAAPLTSTSSSSNDSARDRLERAVDAGLVELEDLHRVHPALARGQRLGAARVAGDAVDDRRGGSARAAPSRRRSRSSSSGVSGQCPTSALAKAGETAACSTSRWRRPSSRRAEARARPPGRARGRCRRCPRARGRRPARRPRARSGGRRARWPATACARRPSPAGAGRGCRAAAARGSSSSPKRVREHVRGVAGDVLVLVQVARDHERVARAGALDDAQERVAQRLAAGARRACEIALDEGAVEVQISAVEDRVGRHRVYQGRHRSGRVLLRGQSAGAAWCAAGGAAAPPRRASRGDGARTRRTCPRTTSPGSRPRTRGCAS